MVATILEPRGLTRTEARLASSYQPGDIVLATSSPSASPRRAGPRKLSRGKPYDAIRTLGHAELQLAKHEHAERFVVALVTYHR